MEQEEPSFIVGGNENKMTQPLRRIVGQFLTKLNRLLTCDLAVRLLGIYLRELKMCVHALMNVYHGFTYNCPNVEGTKMLFSR